VSGALDGLRVLDLSWGVAGPMTGMLLADHGAEVTKIEPPGGDPFRAMAGARVWHRGKRSAVLDLHDAADRDVLLALAARADVLLESYAPGVTERLGVDFDTLRARNPRLVYCSITGYGRGTRDAHRPAYDALVAARTGLHWEQRGWVGGTLERLAGRPPLLPELDVPEGAPQGATRDGPLFPASFWPSLAACVLATSGVTAALRARELTGRGQWVETSLLQGVLCLGLGSRQRVERPDAPHYATWIPDARSPKGLFECADGRWVHHWVPNPRFVLGASAGDELRVPERAAAPRDDPTRIGTDPEELVVLLHYYPMLAAAFRRFPADDWVRVGREVGVVVQPVRSPEEALTDPMLIADGCVTVVEDPELGPIHQVGVTCRLDATPATVRAAAPRAGEHTDAVRAEARAGAAPATQAPRANATLRGPLDGVNVLDLGLAVAGPFGAQVLADLGADVVKVNALYDGYWHANHIAFSCNRGKRSVAVNLKDPRGMAVLHRLVERSDVVMHNMRDDAARRLGVDDESLRRINPALIYCHTRAFERGPRDGLPGNDQSGAALAGVEYEDGGCAAGGRPIWSLTSMGDTGNGFLGAIGIIQALYHRERTGVGQTVDTSILYACLLNTSYAWARPDGSPAPRPHLDASQLGLGPWYRLYETAAGWLCLAAVTDDQRERCVKALGIDAPVDAATDDRLAATLERTFRERSASEWFELLDANDVPCEISSDTYALGLFDDPELAARRWIVSYDHPLVGRLDQFGVLVDFSDTPGTVDRPPLVVGDHSREILAEAGLSTDEIDALCDDGVVLDAHDPPRTPDARR
jgi:crotonobetainyl-CoA:carnitine CoA-transferase CaiB-like acyl-CoA transferase